jgi:hypothetical protein
MAYASAGHRQHALSLPVPILVGLLAARLPLGDLVIAVEVLQAAGFVGYPLTHDPATVDSSNGDQPTRRDATANRQHLDSATRHGEPKGPRHEGHRDHRLPADAYTILPKRSSDDVQERVAPRRSPTPSPQTPIESLAERQI